MTRLLTLPDFETVTDHARPEAPEPSAATPVSDDDRLAAYEAGYQSGWDDCTAAEAEQQRRMSADLASNLADMQFTYAEARRDVLTALGPLFEDMAALLLPRLAAEAIAPTVIAELEAVANRASEASISLLAAPQTVPVLERLAEAEPRLDIQIKPEPAFAEGQISVRFDGQRCDIDLSEAAERMAAAIRAFAQDSQQDPETFRKGAA